MRRHCKVIAAIGVALLLAAPALAQFQVSPGGGGLINTASVQKELKLTDEQIEKAKKVSQEVFAKFKDEFAKLKDVKPEERREKVQEIGKKMADETTKALADVLKPEQLKRFKQIELQQRGLGDSDAQKELKLTDEQKAKIKEIVDSTRKEQIEIFKNSQGNLEAAREKSTKLRKESNDKQSAVLTDAQKKQWQDLIGEPFELKFELRPKN